MSVFKCEQSTFCSSCGTLLRIGVADLYVSCHICAQRRELTDFVGSKNVTRSRDLELKFAHVNVKSNEGHKLDATISEECPQCGAQEMSFTTAQLRSADEGQTVFYACKCGYVLNLTRCTRLVASWRP
eukprot:m.54229 g.54229  ORF g.54229 m.54229 type:complete len:128 (+) comp48712_c0_seq2:120-503(+)